MENENKVVHCKVCHSEHGWETACGGTPTACYHWISNRCGNCADTQTALVTTDFKLSALRAENAKLRRVVEAARAALTGILEPGGIHFHEIVTLKKALAALDAMGETTTGEPK